MSNENYTPYGEEWRKEMEKLPKKVIIEMFSKIGYDKMYLAELANYSLATKIMEATGRFEFTKERDGVLIFWDNHWENEHSIRADWSLEKLMQWITQFYSEDFMWQGEQKAQRKIRTALGLD